MPNCSAFGRTNRSDNPDNNATFHRLPSVDKKQAGVWRNKIKRKGAEDLSSLRISSDHFESECFERDLKSELMGTKKRGKLKPNSIPTIFAFSRKKNVSRRTFQVVTISIILVKQRRNRRNTQGCLRGKQCENENPAFTVAASQVNIPINTEITFLPDTYSSTASSQAREIAPEDESDMDTTEEELDESYHISSPTSQTESDSDTCKSDKNSSNSANSHCVLDSINTFA